MMDRDARAREIMNAIGAILLKEWDPIGVKDEPLAQGEYEGYIGGVYRLLASRATEMEVAEHLSRAEAESIGFAQGSAVDLLPVARRLLALNVRLDDGSAD
jgi:hypothetical protein